MHKDTYEKLVYLRKAIGGHCSFQTVVSLLVQQSAGNIVDEKVYLKFTRRKFQRLAITRLYHDLFESDLIHFGMDIDSFMALLLQIFDNNWLDLANIVNSKVDFLKAAEKNSKESEEVLKSHWMKKADQLNHTEDSIIDGKIHTTVGDAESIISTPPQSEKSTENTKQAKPKNKRK